MTAKRAEQFVTPPSRFVLLSAVGISTDVDCPEGTRGLLVGQAGTLNVTMEDGSQSTGLPFLQGITPGMFATVRTGGDAQNIWAVV